MHLPTTAAPTPSSALPCPLPSFLSPRSSDNVDDYVVVDPLLEAGKAKFNKAQAKAKKRQTEWAGRAQG